MRLIRTDCRHYRGAAPCDYHKRDGRLCGNCPDCDPIASRILIVKLAAAGDVLRTTALLPPLRRAWPGAEITWITDADSRPVLEGHPLVDRLWTPAECVPHMLTERFDAVYGLDADSRAGALSALARAQEHFGFVCDERGRVVPARDSAARWWRMGLDDGLKRANRHTYQALMREVCELDGDPARPYFVVPDASRRRARAVLRRHEPGLDGAVIGLNTGGGQRWAQKKWTVAGYGGFLALCRARHPDVTVVLMGGPEERGLHAQLYSGEVPGVIDAGCDHSFADFAALIEAMDLLVTSDSLGLHAALAVGTPVVAFAGPTAPWELELYGDGSVVHADVGCLGCYRARCDKPVTCMEQLDPAVVLGAVERLLPRVRPERHAVESGVPVSL